MSKRPSERNTGYRISRKVVASIPIKKQLSAIVKPIWKDWGLRHDSSPEKFLRLLTPGQRAFLLLLNLEEQVHDDGLYLYLWNSGNELPYAIKALRVVGATKYIPILGAAGRIFRSSKIIASRRMRQAELRKQQKGEIDKRFHEVFDPLNGRKKAASKLSCGPT